jgi:galactonate dehydratase
MAEAYDVAVAPHCPLAHHSGRVSAGGFLHANAFIQEQSLGIHYNQGSDLLIIWPTRPVFHYHQGYVARLTAHRSGHRINEEKGENGGYRPPVAHPVWRNEDGSVTEW